MVFCWWANNGPLLVVIGSSLSPHQLKKKVVRVELNPLWQNCLDPVWYASNSESIPQWWWYSYDWRRATAGWHTQLKHIVFFIGCSLYYYLFVANGDTTAHYQKVLHFIRVCNVCKGKNDLQTKEYNIFLKIITWHPRYVQWTIPSLLYQTRSK